MEQSFWQTFTFRIERKTVALEPKYLPLSGYEVGHFPNFDIFRVEDNDKKPEPTQINKMPNSK